MATSTDTSQRPSGRVPRQHRQALVVLARKLRAWLRRTSKRGAAAEVIASVTPERLMQLFPTGEPAGVCHACNKRSAKLAPRVFQWSAEGGVQLHACCLKCLRKSKPRKPTSQPRKTTYTVWCEKMKGRTFGSRGERLAEFKALQRTFRARDRALKGMTKEERQRTLTADIKLYRACDAEMNEWNKEARRAAQTQMHRLLQAVV